MLCCWEEQLGAGDVDATGVCVGSRDGVIRGRVATLVVVYGNRVECFVDVVGYGVGVVVVVVFVIVVVDVAGYVVRKVVDSGDVGVDLGAVEFNDNECSHIIIDHLLNYQNRM